MVYMPIVTTGSTTSNLTYTTGTAPYANGAIYVNGWAPAQAPEPQGPLAWLDAEIEKTCALARCA